MVDDKDKQILNILKKNARSTNTEIAKAVRLTEGSVRNRIAKLVSNGTIRRFTIETSVAARYGIVMVKAKDDTKRMMRNITKLGLSKDAYEISGEYDACIIVEGESIEDIDEKIDQIRKLKSVDDTRTFISLRRW